MRRLLLIVCALFFASQSAQSQQSPLTVLGAGPASGYTGPGDIVSGAYLWWGLRGYRSSYSGSAVNVCTPTDAACADITISNGTLVIPGALSGCNNSGSICTIRTWYDQSGSTNCVAAACDITQATEASRSPLIVPGAANGCPTAAMYCAGPAPAFYVSAANMSSTVQPFSFAWAAARVGSFTTQQSIVATLSSALTNAGFQNVANTLFCNSGAVGTKASVADSAFHAVQMVFSGVSSTIAADGSTSTVSCGTNGFGITTLGTIRGMGLTNSNMLEFGAWSGAFSAAQISSLNTNTHNYWGF